MLTTMNLYNGYSLEQIIEAGSKRKLRFDFEMYKPDILGEVFYFKNIEGARATPVTSGYRPQHKVREDYLTSGEHIYFENEIVFPGEKAKVYVKFILPEHHPKCLNIGGNLELSEGSRVVGYVTVNVIYNRLLLADQQ